MIGQTVGGALRTIATTSPLAAEVVGELVAGNSKEPWSKAVPLPSKRRETSERLFEGGGGDVFRNGRIATAPKGKPIDGVDMALIERGKGVGVGTRPLDERLLVELSRVSCGRVHQPPA